MCPARAPSLALRSEHSAPADRSHVGPEAAAAAVIGRFNGKTRRLSNPRGINFGTYLAPQ